MLNAFFTPVPTEIWSPLRDSDDICGGKILIHGNTFPSLKKVKLAIIGIGESANLFRKEFYRLYGRFEKLQVADLGNIVEPENEKDRLFAISEAMSELLGMGILVVVVGGGGRQPS